MMKKILAIVLAVVAIAMIGFGIYTMNSSKYIFKTAVSGVFKYATNAYDDFTEFTIPDTYRRDFFEELEDLDTEDCSKLIKDRVADSITNFIDANISNRLDYEEVLQTATDQIDRVNVNTNESAVKEKAISSINSRTKMRLNEMRQSKSKNIYQAIVEQITKASIKDDDMKARFVNESGVNMDRVTNAAQMIYTVLEMVNTTQMVDINETYLDNYLNSLR